MILSDKQIIERVKNEQMIAPFVHDQIQEGVISYGLSSYGYDARIADEFKVFTDVWNTVVDPKHFDPHSFIDVNAGDKGYILIPPNSFALAKTVEYFKIPRDILVIVLSKSTYARAGIVFNVTPFEPEWEGIATIEISNTTPLPAKIYANEGAVQLVFHKAEDICQVSYADKKGKYQGTKKIVGPKVVGGCGDGVSSRPQVVTNDGYIKEIDYKQVKVI